MIIYIYILYIHKTIYYIHKSVMTWKRVLLLLCKVGITVCIAL